MDEAGPERPERLGLEVPDVQLPADQQGQGGRLDAAHAPHALLRAGAAHAQGLGPGGVDAHQPVRLLAAAGGVPQARVGLAGPHGAVGLAHGLGREAGGPEAQHRLGAARQAVHQVEDQLALASGVRGVHHLGDVLAVQQPRHHLELLPGLGDGRVAEGLREDGQPVPAPGLPGRVVALGVQGLHQMAHAPGHHQAVPLQEAPPPPGHAQGLRQGAAHARFLGDDQAQERLPGASPIVGGRREGSTAPAPSAGAGWR